MVYTIDESGGHIGHLTNQNKKKFKSLKSKENIHKNEDWHDCTVSINSFSSVTL